MNLKSMFDAALTRARSRTDKPLRVMGARRVPGGAVADVQVLDRDTGSVSLEAFLVLYNDGSWQVLPRGGSRDLADALRPWWQYIFGATPQEAFSRETGLRGLGLPETPSGWPLPDHPDLSVEEVVEEAFRHHTIKDAARAYAQAFDLPFDEALQAVGTALSIAASWLYEDDGITEEYAEMAQAAQVMLDNGYLPGVSYEACKPFYMRKVR